MEEMEDVPKQYEFVSESYVEQVSRVWPGKGKHILAQSDEESVVVYQAFPKEIAEYAVENKKFTGCECYNESRMTWIKTNFMWMMYRSGWGSKQNQQHILAIWLKRGAFERYLENAKIVVTNKKELGKKPKNENKEMKGSISVQWDPDHDHTGKALPYRKAIQIGLRKISSFAGGEDILCIKDISEFVAQQRSIVKDKKKNPNIENLIVARERVYFPRSERVVNNIGLSVYEKECNNDR